MFSVQNTNTSSASNWMQLAFTVDKKKRSVSFHQDGSLLGSVNGSTDMNQNNQSSFSIGYSPITDDYFSGKMGDFKVFNTPLKDSEVVEERESHFMPLIKQNEWTHLQVNYSKKDRKVDFYKNASKVGSILDYDVGPAPNTNDLVLGKNFVGDIGDVNLFERELFESEIHTLVNDPLQYEQTEALLSVRATDYGAMNIVSGKVRGAKAIRFGAADTVTVSLPTNMDLSVLSAEGWVSPSTSGVARSLLKVTDGTSTFFDWSLDASNKLRLSFGTDTVADTTTAINANDWVHLAVRADKRAGSTEFYVNGKLMSSHSTTVESVTATTSLVAKVGDSFVGDLDSMNLLAGRMSQKEIANRGDLQRDVLVYDVVNTVLEFGFDESGTDTMAVDTSPGQNNGVVVNGATRVPSYAAENRGMRFDASADQYVTVPGAPYNNLDLSVSTMSAWVRHKDYATSSSQGSILQQSGVFDLSVKGDHVLSLGVGADAGSYFSGTATRWKITIVGSQNNDMMQLSEFYPIADTTVPSSVEVMSLSDYTHPFIGDGSHGDRMYADNYKNGNMVDQMNFGMEEWLIFVFYSAVSLTAIQWATKDDAERAPSSNCFKLEWDNNGVWELVGLVGVDNYTVTEYPHQTLHTLNLAPSNIELFETPSAPDLFANSDVTVHAADKTRMLSGSKWRVFFPSAQNVTDWIEISEFVLTDDYGTYPTSIPAGAGVHAAGQLVNCMNKDYSAYARFNITGGNVDMVYANESFVPTKILLGVFDSRDRVPKQIKIQSTTDGTTYTDYVTFEIPAQLINDTPTRTPFTYDFKFVQEQAYWLHYAVTLDAFKNQIKMYRNGALVRTVDNANVSLVCSAQDVSIGKSFNGDLDDVKVATGVEWATNFTVAARKATHGVDPYWSTGIGSLSPNPGPGTISTEQWAHVAAVYEKHSNRVCVYHNGEMVGCYKNYLKEFSAPGTGTANIILAKEGDNYFDGSMDDVRVYSKCLDMAAVKDLYKMYDPPRKSFEGDFALSFDADGIHMSDMTLLEPRDMSPGETVEYYIFAAGTLFLQNATQVYDFVTSEATPSNVYARRKVNAQGVPGVTSTWTDVTLKNVLMDTTTTVHYKAVGKVYVYVVAVYGFSKLYFTTHPVQITVTAPMVNLNRLEYVPETNTVSMRATVYGNNPVTQHYLMAFESEDPGTDLTYATATEEEKLDVLYNFAKDNSNTGAVDADGFTVLAANELHTLEDLSVTHVFDKQMSNSMKPMTPDSATAAASTTTNVATLRVPDSPDIAVPIRDYLYEDTLLHIDFSKTTWADESKYARTFNTNTMGTSTLNNEKSSSTNSGTQYINTSAVDINTISNFEFSAAIALEITNAAANNFFWWQWRDGWSLEGNNFQIGGTATGRIITTPDTTWRAANKQLILLAKNTTTTKKYTVYDLNSGEVITTVEGEVSAADITYLQNATNAGSYTFNIGAGYANAEGAYSNYGELMFVNRCFSDGEEAAVVNYLRRKWASPRPSLEPFYPAQHVAKGDPMNIISQMSITYSQPSPSEISLVGNGWTAFALDTMVDKSTIGVVYDFEVDFTHSANADLVVGLVPSEINDVSVHPANVWSYGLLNSGYLSNYECPRLHLYLNSGMLTPTSTDTTGFISGRYYRMTTMNNDVRIEIFEQSDRTAESLQYSVRLRETFSTTLNTLDTYDKYYLSFGLHAGSLRVSNLSGFVPEPTSTTLSPDIEINIYQLSASQGDGATTYGYMNALYLYDVYNGYSASGSRVDYDVVYHTAGQDVHGTGPNGDAIELLKDSAYGYYSFNEAAGTKILSIRPHTMFGSMYIGFLRGFYAFDVRVEVTRASTGMVIDSWSTSGFQGMTANNTGGGVTSEQTLSFGNGIIQIDTWDVENTFTNTLNSASTVFNIDPATMTRDAMVFKRYDLEVDFAFEGAFNGAGSVSLGGKVITLLKNQSGVPHEVNDLTFEGAWTKYWTVRLSDRWGMTVIGYRTDARATPVWTLNFEDLTVTEGQIDFSITASTNTTLNVTNMLKEVLGFNTLRAVGPVEQYNLFMLVKSDGIVYKSEPFIYGKTNLIDRVVGFGRDDYGSTTITETAFPTDILQEFTADGGVSHLSVGYTYASFVHKGKLYMWGKNDDGQWGNGTTSTTAVTTPTEVTSSCPFEPDDIDILFCGWATSIVVLKNRDVWGVGNNSGGLLATGNTSHQSQWVKIPVPTHSRVKRLENGGLTAVWLLENGEAYFTGRGTPHGNHTAITSVTKVALQWDPDAKIKDVAVTAVTAFFLLEDGHLYANGERYGGQLGNGNNDGHVYQTKFPSNNSANYFQPGTENEAVMIRGSHRDMLVVTVGGHLWKCGNLTVTWANYETGAYYPNKALRG